MAVVLNFPKDGQARQTMQQKLRDQKTHLLMSIAAVLVVSVMTNEWLTRPQGAGRADLASHSSSSRGIASVGSVDPRQQIKIDEKIAKDLADRPAEGVLAGKPSLRDEMVFGFLEGKYGVRTADGKIRSLEFLQMKDSEQAMFIPDRTAFIQRYKDVFAVSFAKIGVAEAGPESEKFKLMDANNNILGEAVFKLNSQGQVLSLDIQKL